MDIDIRDSAVKEDIDKKFEQIRRLKSDAMEAAKYSTNSEEYRQAVKEREKLEKQVCNQLYRLNMATS